MMEEDVTTIVGNSEEIVSGIIQAQIGSHSDHDLIESHMNEYFTRFGAYKGKFTELEWYHIFLDFLDSLHAKGKIK